MNGLETLAHLNSIEDMKVVLNRKPPRRLFNVESVFKSPDYSGVNGKILAKASGMKILDTYFVDSSGFGGDGIAMELPTFKSTIEHILAEAKKNGKKLYSCLTGIGQFQVYVTVLEK